MPTAAPRTDNTTPNDLTRFGQPMLAIALVGANKTHCSFCGAILNDQAEDFPDPEHYVHEKSLSGDPMSATRIERIEGCGARIIAVARVGGVYTDPRVEQAASQSVIDLWPGIPFVDARYDRKLGE